MTTKTLLQLLKTIGKVRGLFMFIFISYGGGQQFLSIVNLSLGDKTLVSKQEIKNGKSL